MMFNIIYNKNKKDTVNEKDLREWLCGYPFYNAWYGAGGLCDRPKYRDENGNHNDKWFAHIEEILDSEIEVIVDTGKKEYSWTAGSTSMPCAYDGATVMYVK